MTAGADTYREAALSDFRRRIERRKRGRVVCTVEIERREVVTYRIEEDSNTTQDLIRSMTERPHPRRTP